MGEVSAMTSRERLLTALHGGQPDRVPMPLRMQKFMRKHYAHIPNLLDRTLAAQEEFGTDVWYHVASPKLPCFHPHATNWRDDVEVEIKHEVRGRRNWWERTIHTPDRESHHAVPRDEEQSPCRLVSCGLWIATAVKPLPAGSRGRCVLGEDALRTALEVSDEYVWLYSEQLNWWTGKNVPEEYREAVRRARHAIQDIGSAKVLGRTAPPLTGRARDQPSYDDKATFGALWKTHDFVADLPTTWKFRKDPTDVGQTEKWYAANLADTDWQEIEIGEWWEPQGVHYDGIAWYRVRFHVPKSAEGRKLALSFGAVDESAWLYLNGKEIGKSDLGESGWDKRFEIPLPADITSDAENVLAVRVWDRTAYGGIWKSVKLVAEKVR